MPKRSNTAYPVKPGEARKIARLEPEEMRRLLRSPKSRRGGWFYARMETGEWMGADTHFGAIPRKITGTFREVIEWLIPTVGETRNPSREKVWKAGGTRQVPLLIEGAEIKEWKWDVPEVMGLDDTPVAGRDAVFLSRSRARGGRAVGATNAAKAAERDKRILEMFRAGKTYREIAEVVGLTEGTISHRLKMMQEADPNIRIGERQHDKEKIAALDKRILACLQKGMTQAQTARVLEEKLKRIAHRVAAMRSRGVSIPDSYNDRMQAEKMKRSREAWRLKEKGMSCREIAEVMNCAESTARKLVRTYRESEGAL